MKQNDAYDGRLVLVMDKYLNERDYLDARNIVYVSPGGQERPLPWTIEASLFSSLYEEYRSGWHRERTKDCLHQELRSRLKILQRQGSVAHAVLRQRLHLSLLLNTRGGHTAVADAARRFSHSVEEKGGNVDAYATTEAQSAGSLICTGAQKIFALPHTEFLWHSGTIHHHLPSKEFIRDSTVGDMLYFLLRVKPQHLGIVTQKFSEAINDKGNPQNDVTFSGEELHRLGIVDRICRNVQEMRKHFTRRTGIPVDLDECVDNPIARYFLNSEIEEGY